ncbi:uncharacterized protein LOC120334656 isoform X2 [Styela clava]
MNIVAILAVCLATYVGEAASHADSECRLPVTNKINFAQLRGKNWFTTLRNIYSGTRKGVCVVISDVEETNRGLDIYFKMFKNSEIVNNFTIHNKLQPSGRYIWEPTSDTEKDPFSPIGEETERKKERNHIKWLSDYTKQHTYLTDYKTYLFELECDFEGKDISHKQQ